MRKSLPLLRLFPLILLLASAHILSGCSEKKNPSVEPQGANLALIPILAKSDIKVAPPPEPKSDQQKKEADELLALEKERNPEKESLIKSWGVSSPARWNEIARDLVAKHRTDAPMSSRIYALVSVAQHDALVAALKHQREFNRPVPGKMISSLHPLESVSEDRVYPSGQAAVASASAIVLTYIYPDEEKFLLGKVVEHQESRLMAGANFRSDIVAGDALGKEIGKVIVSYARTDGADTAPKAVIPVESGRWFSAPNVEPIAAHWRNVKPWLMTSPEQFRAPEPLAFSSAEFKALNAEVKQISDNLTPEQARVGAFWADGPGSYTPPGRWNKIAADLISKYGANEFKSARVFALLNMAMNDAGIACFDTKYHFRIMRPSQAEPSINLRLGLPNHPSYPSAHSCFSGAGAELLSYIFPAEAESLRTKVDEAGLSRVYTGIHTRQDKEAGEVMGRKVGQLAIEREKADGSKGSR